jgi:ABC-type uncharacterized transport system ATPase subunit
MPKDDNNNVVKLRQPPAKVAGVGVDEAIQPKSLLNMTDVEQEVFLNTLRERRLRASQILKRAASVKRQADTVTNMIRLEKKTEQAQKQYDKASKAFDKLEELLYSLRAMALQHTDVDITKLTSDDKPRK